MFQNINERVVFLFMYLLFLLSEWINKLLLLAPSYITKHFPLFQAYTRILYICRLILGDYCYTPSAFNYCMLFLRLVFSPSARSAWCLWWCRHNDNGVCKIFSPLSYFLMLCTSLHRYDWNACVSFIDRSRIPLGCP